MRPEDWPTSPANRLAAHEKAISPLALSFTYGAKLPRLATPEAWMDADAALDTSYADALRNAGASAEAMRLIEANMNGNTLTGMSQLGIAAHRGYLSCRTWPHSDGQGRIANACPKRWPGA